MNTRSVFLPVLAVLTILLATTIALNRTPDTPSGAASVRDALLPPALAGFGTDGLSVFEGYTAWTHSNAYRTDNRTFEALIAVSNPIAGESLYVTEADMNGDGLTDIFYHNVSKTTSVPKYFAVFINEGGLSYSLEYKCVSTHDGTPHYYGDCADTGNPNVMAFPVLISDYVGWTSSATIIAEDLFPSVLTLLVDTNGFPASDRFFTLTDINADGLTDVLYHHTVSSTGDFKVYLNKGNLRFDLVYKCHDHGNGTNPRFYGDCAETGGGGNPTLTDFFWPVYSTWNSSAAIDPDDTTVQALSYAGVTGNTLYSRSYYSLTDMNGDGLVDLAYHVMPSSSPAWYKFGVFLNTGTMNFDPVYRCFNKLDTHTYYGDCAAGS